MLQQDVADDFVIATGVAHSVRECLEIAFDQAGWRSMITSRSMTGCARPAEVDQLIGDASKAERAARLGAADQL